MAVDVGGRLARAGGASDVWAAGGMGGPCRRAAGAELDGRLAPAECHTECMTLGRAAKAGGAADLDGRRRGRAPSRRQRRPWTDGRAPEQRARQVECLSPKALGGAGAVAPGRLNA